MSENKGNKSGGSSNPTPPPAPVNTESTRGGNSEPTPPPAPQNKFYTDSDGKK